MQSPSRDTLKFVFEVLDSIEGTSKRTLKEETLQGLSSDPVVEETTKTLLHAALDPFTLFGVEISPDEVTGVEIGDPAMEWMAFQSLIRSAQTGRLQRSLVLEVLERFGSARLKWYLRVLNKDLKMGVGAKTVEKVFPGLVPDFGVQLCETFDPSKSFSGEWLGEVKVDGVRGFLLPGGVVSRNGKPLYNYEVVKDALAATGVLDTHVPDVEFWHPDGFDKTISIVRTQGVHSDAKDLQCYLLDLVPKDEFATRTGASPLKERVEVADLVASLSPSPCILRPETRVVRSRDDVLRAMDEFVSRGYEGIVLKRADSVYRFKRTRDWQKFKPTESVDLPVVGYETGYLNWARNTVEEVWFPGATTVVQRLVVDYKGKNVGVGSGFTRERRVAWADNPDLILGKVIEVKYQNVTEDGSLRFPVFARVREDKEVSR